MELYIGLHIFRVIYVNLSFENRFFKLSAVAFLFGSVDFMGEVDLIWFGKHSHWTASATIVNQGLAI